MVNFSYRVATEEDVMLYFNWANDSMVRQNAISTEPIQLEGHKKWFASRIKRPSTVMYVFEIESTPFGQVRFDIEDAKAFIDYSIDEKFRGKGLGVKMLKSSIVALKKENRTDFAKIVGVVKKSNIPSTKVFERLGFTEDRKDIIDNTEYIIFSLS